jgi:hypothetical protein
VRLHSISILLAVCSMAAFGQGDRATVTGTISDPAGAVVANAPIEAKNTQTGAVYQTASTATGNYTLSQLPVGSYELDVTVPGFKKYVRQNIVLQVAQVLRQDVALEVGSATEAVTVSAEVTLLKTESGELSHNVSTAQLDNLPILGIGQSFAGSSGIRNPQAAAFLLPGSYVQPNSNVRINGAPGNTASYRIEGQDASNGQVPATQAQTQPSIDAIQEVTIQTSNFAAEYGQVGGGFFNYTMKSGTNQIHGSAYDYFVNEAFNSNTPWVNTKPVARRNDYGFTVGGPVVLPKIYNGHDKTFFFFNWEQFRETIGVNNQTITLPIAAYRAGNFAPALTGKSLGPDVLGNTIIENGVYDPSSTMLTSSGQRVRTLYPGNQVPLTSFDPVAQKIQALIPATTRTGLINNAILPYVSQRVTDIPTVKLDHSLGSKAKLSYLWQQTRTASQYSQTFGASDGLPLPITAAIGTFIHAHIQRLNFEYTVTPTLLFHAGVGYQDNNFTDDPPVLDYNPLQDLGLKGATVNRLFPAFSGLSTTSQGGMKNMGPGSNRHPLIYEKPTANTSLTWVKDNHTYKIGGELRIDSNASTLYNNTAGAYAFSSIETGQPYLQATTVSGSNIGFPYASFLLGDVDSYSIAPTNNIRLGKHSIGLFIQDTWKITRKLTLDYGLRWDYSTYLKEQYGKLAQFAPLLPNAAAGGHLGAVQFEGDGPGTCNCSFANNYPYAIGPRLGVAYQITPKTVLRGGWGIVYSGTGDANGATQGALTLLQPALSPTFGDPVINLQNGVPPPPPFPNFDPAQYPQTGYATKQAPAVWYDQNAGRPPRMMQWSLGIQRELTKDLLVEATYVGNRGVWWYSSQLIDVNALTPQILTAAGLNINSAADQAILKATIGSGAAGRFQNKLPYAGFPTTATVAQSLRPFPQFSSISSLWSPLGKTWYDSLQTKVTKRLSHGLTFSSVFTWQKQFALGAASNPVVGAAGTSGGAPVNDVFNRGLNKYLSQYDQPYTFNIAINYRVPTKKFGSSMAMQAASWAVRDWSVNTLLAYASGLPIQAPAAQSNLATYLFRNTFANRVPGQPLFTQDLNCHCFDPTKTFVLNPNAWADPAIGQFGTSAAYYSDYRQQRRPNETMSLGRIFRIRERMDFNLRIEFSNVFNRAQLPNPTSTNAKATQTCLGGACTTSSVVSGGFGFINTAAVAATTTTGTPSSRQGTLVGRFTF